MQQLYNRNETLLGPSPKCLEVLQDVTPEQLYRYIDGYYGSSLIPTLAEHHHIPEKQIVLANGAEGVLKLLFDSLAPETDTVLTHELHFGYYDTYTQQKGIQLKQFRLQKSSRSFAFDIADCIFQYNTYRPKVILITSPNNPTGNSLSTEDLSYLLAQVNEQTIVAIDEAYYGFNPTYDAHGYRSLLDTHPNLMLIRSFSKLYALAGLRIGYALAGNIALKQLSWQPPYLGGNRLAEATALAALGDTAYYTHLANIYIRDRDIFIKQINTLNHFKAYESNASCVTIEVDPSIRDALKEHLQKQPVTICKWINDSLIRVSLDPKQYTRQLIELLKSIGGSVSWARTYSTNPTTILSKVRSVLRSNPPKKLA